MLELKGVSLSFDRAILKNINLNIQAGEILGLVGKSGAGKSSLLKIIAGIIAPNEGKLFFDKKELPAANSLLIPGFKGIAIVNQDFKLDLYHTVEENIRESILHLPIPERDKRVLKLLRLFELTKISSTKAHLISGGEKQRLAIARAVANKPRLLVLDEPFGNLDSSLRLKISNFLLTLREEENIAILLVSHDGQDVLGLCDSICHLQNGRISKKKKAETLYYDCGNLQVARLFGPVNQVEINGEIHCFRPDEYEFTTDTNGIEIEFIRATFAGGFYHNYFKDKNNSSLLLYSLTTLDGHTNFRIKRKQQ